MFPSNPWNKVAVFISAKGMDMLSGSMHDISEFPFITSAPHHLCLPTDFFDCTQPKSRLKVRQKGSQSDFG